MNIAPDNACPVEQVDVMAQAVMEARVRYGWTFGKRPRVMAIDLIMAEAAARAANLQADADSCDLPDRLSYAAKKIVDGDTVSSDQVTGLLWEAANILARHRVRTIPPAAEAMERLIRAARAALPFVVGEEEANELEAALPLTDAGDGGEPTPRPAPASPPPPRG